MVLTPAQLSMLKADIIANANTIPAGQPWTGSFGGLQVRDVPQSGDGAFAIAGWYSQTASPAYIVWRDLAMETVLSLIAFANMTPTDAVPTTPALTVDVFRTRAIVCQGKQMNLQNLIISRTVAPMKQVSYRAALQDCLTNLPAGASGSLISANWVGVRDAAKFDANNVEKLFAIGAGTTATPSNLTYEGAISAADIETALNLP